MFNEFWKGVYKGEAGNPPKNPTSDKELAIWQKQRNKAYALITTLINEEARHHIAPFTNSFEALKKLKYLYDSHAEVEVVQLMINLINLELQYDDPLSLA